jgi:hypothetical protein
MLKIIYLMLKTLIFLEIELVDLEAEVQYVEF